MKNKFKYSIPSISIFGVLFGRILNRELTRYFGNNASNIVVAICIAIVFYVILLTIIMKQYITAIGLFVMATPLIICGIGIYRDNIGLMGMGILSVFIIYPIFIKIVKRLRLNR